MKRRIISLVMCVVMVLGLIGAASAQVPMPYTKNPEPFKVNGHGSTYGTALYATEMEEISQDWEVNSLGMTYAFEGVCTGGRIYEPTLVAAVGRDEDGNRVEGYILSKGAYTDTVEDLLNWSKTVKEMPIPFFIAPLYNSEFEQIGGFQVGGTVPIEGAEQDAFWATYFESLKTGLECISRPVSYTSMQSDVKRKSRDLLLPPVYFYPGGLMCMA